MKKILTVLTLLLTLAISNQSFAQDFSKIDKEKNNYIILTKKLGQLKPIILASEEMKKKDGDNFGVFHVVFCGKNVEDLVDKRRMKKHLERLKGSSVKLIACGFSLKKFDINPKRLPEGIDVVDNGISYALKLKKMGFFGLEL